MKRTIFMLLAAALVASLLGTSCEEPVTPPPPAPSEKAITAFSFTSPAATGVINEGAKTIAVTVPFGTDRNGLIATFTTTGASVKVGVTDQVSGVTPNDFTAPVVYTVTATDASTANYTVTVTIAPASSEKAILAFSFASPAATGTINEGAKTVTLYVPEGTAVNDLVAAFTLSPFASADIGGTAQVSGVTHNDFTGAVVYRITAQDASTVNYTVTVNVMAVVMYANFQTLPAGMTENTEITLPAPVALPMVTNTNGYTINLEGKCKVNTTQTPPGGTSGWSDGCFQSGNNTSSIGKITLTSIPGPFKLIINWIPSSTGDATRKLRIMINGSEVYYDGDGQARTTVYDYIGSSTVNIEIYGYNGSNGAGVRVLDFWMQK